MDNSSIKQAIGEYYTSEQWLIIMLKQQWLVEGFSHTQRESLQLNDYMRVEITAYLSVNKSTIRQVYIELKSPRSLRPVPISCAVDIAQPYEQISKQVHNLIKQARSELFQLYRGREWDYQVLVR